MTSTVPLSIGSAGLLAPRLDLVSPRLYVYNTGAARQRLVIFIKPKAMGCVDRGGGMGGNRSRKGEVGTLPVTSCSSTRRPGGHFYPLSDTRRKWSLRVSDWNLTIVYQTRPSCSHSHPISPIRAI